MASYYVWSGAGGAGTGADWANAYTSLVTAVTSKAAGDIFYVAHDHAESAAATKTVIFTASPGLPQRVYCVNRGGSVPPVAADLRDTASITSTGTFQVGIQGSGSVYGIQFISGSTLGVTSNGKSLKLTNCSLVTTSASAANIQLSGSGSTIILDNTPVKFNAANQLVTITSVDVIWRNTPSPLIAGSVVPAAMIRQTSGGKLLLENMDFSAINTTLYEISSGPPFNVVVLKDCKLHASAALTSWSGITNYAAADIVVSNCDSGDTNYKNERHHYSGVLTTDIATVMSGGASDGTTPISWKIVTSANSVYEFPFNSLPIWLWNDTVGSPVTVTIEGIWNNGVLPLDDEIWIEVQHIRSSVATLSAKASSGKATPLTAGANVGSSAATWSGSAVVEFKMTVTFTPQEKGPMAIVVCAAKPSTTFYIDPKPIVT